MINPPNMPINDKARNDAHIASAGVRLLRTPALATSKTETRDASKSQLNQAS